MTQAHSIAKPLPSISDFNRPFWEAARRHEFHLQCCNDCGREWAPPGPVCPHCFSTSYTWKKASGKGKIASFVVFHKVYHQGFAKDVPYNVAFVELAEGPRIIANVVGTPNEKLKIGMPLEVTFDDINEQISIPRFRAVA